MKEYAYEKGSWDCTLEALKKSFHSSNCDGDLKVPSKSKRAEVQLRFNIQLHTAFESRANLDGLSGMYECMACKNALFSVACKKVKLISNKTNRR